MEEDIPDRSQDGELVARLVAGDDAAYAEVLDRYGGRLLATARRIVRNEDDARDVVQESMLAAFRSIGEFEAASSVATWLHRIAVNASLMKLRARRRRPESPVDPLLPEFTESGHFAAVPERWAEPADAAMSREETRALVREAIERLPPGYREAVLLRDVEGLSNEETAAALGISAGAAKVRVHRGRQALRTLLEPSMRDANP